MQRALLAFFLIALSLPLVVVARQSPPASKPGFDVVSIKQVAPGTYPPGLPDLPATYRPDGLRWGYVSGASLVAGAFKTPERDIESSRVLGGPDWITSTHFEIIATLEHPDVSRAELSAALPNLVRSVLEERFKLQAHIESRSFPVFALVKARADGRLGPGLHPSLVDCAALAREESAKPAGPPTPATAAPSPCRVSRFAAKISASGITLKGLAGNLRVPAGRPVFDQTNIPGSFDVELQWSPDGVDGPALVTALQEQLGLKLEAGQAPMDVVVIDHVEMPSPN
jgi:uncharacterized protein (TIGR03435 family)